MRAASLSLGFGVCFLALGCAAGKARVAAGSEVGDDAVAMRPKAADANVDAGASDAASLGAASEPSERTESAPPAVDPAVAHALVEKSGDGSQVTPLGLRFEIIELGPALPWAFAVVNRGTEAAVVDFDARLLALEIQMPPPAAKSEVKATKAKPGKPVKPSKPVLCRLPADVLPNAVDPALAIKLEPGEGLVQNFDPRLYCVGNAPWPLVEGAEISARFGFAPKMKVTWRGGKRTEEPAVQSEPFVAEPSQAQGSLPEKGEEREPGERRVKQLIGTPFTLGTSFANSLNGPPDERARPSPGLELTITGSDALNEGSAIATATITNRGKKKQDLYFRRELITYEVSGPDGVFQCDPQPDKRAPADRSAVQTLGSGAKLSAASRLIEMCPAHTFARPGLYLVHARFDAADPATGLGFNAFMGRLVSRNPALVRVRHGELPFTPGIGMMRVHVGQ